MLRHLRLQRRDCRADLDRARLGCFGHFANHIDTDQAVVDAGTRHLRVVGEAKAPLEVAPGNAAVQLATAADEEVPRWLFRCEPHQTIGSLIPPDVCVGAGCPPKPKDLISRRLSSPCYGDRGFESISLQRGVRREPEFLRPTERGLISIPAHTASPQSYSAIPSGVALTANANELGLLEVACVSPDACIKQSWRLEFNLRGERPGSERGASGFRISPVRCIQLAPPLISRGTESSQTRRWREMDSNHRYPEREACFFPSRNSLAGTASGRLAGVLPCIEPQPQKKLEPSAERLLGLLHRWRDEAVRAGKKITRIALAFEAGRDGFWLARWLNARGVEAARRVRVLPRWPIRLRAYITGAAWVLEAADQLREEVLGKPQHDVGQKNAGSDRRKKDYVDRQ